MEEQFKRPCTCGCETPEIQTSIMYMLCDPAIRSVWIKCPACGIRCNKIHSHDDGKDREVKAWEDWNNEKYLSPYYEIEYNKHIKTLDQFKTIFAEMIIIRKEKEELVRTIQKLKKEEKDNQNE